MMSDLVYGSENVRYITAEELAEILSDETAKKRAAIIDVRDDDLRDAMIMRAISIPSFSFREKIDGFLPFLAKYDKVIFHCMYSKERGPNCAKCFEQRLNIYLAALPEGNPLKKIHCDIYVLRGGFANFYFTYEKKDEFFQPIPQ